MRSSAADSFPDRALWAVRPTDREARAPDIAALLDLVLDHETDLACDIANYGPIDYPMTAQLLSAVARLVPGFEFNSLRRWLSPAHFEELFPRAGDVAGPVEYFGFGELDESSQGTSIPSVR